MTAPTPFELHPRLAADCVPIDDLPVSRLLLMDDQRFPWCILVPRRPGLTELHHLSLDDRVTVLHEVEAVSLALLECFTVSKINVGTLGNLVPQLHIHVVGRSPEDAAWPGPVWGAGTARRYAADDRDAAADRLRRVLRTSSSRGA